MNARHALLLLILALGLPLTLGHAGQETGDSLVYLPLVSDPVPQGITTLVSIASDGGPGNHHSLAPSISADGRYVAFSSFASNLVEDDTNDCDDNLDYYGVIINCPDIFVHDRQTGETTRVSVASDGAQGNDWSDAPSVSADGRYVAFNSNATNLVDGDANNACYDSDSGTYTGNCSDIFVHDRHTGQTTRASVASDGTEANGMSVSPSISSDGRFVAFTSYATNLVLGDTNGAPDVFVHDRQTGTTTRVSVATDGTQGNDRSGAPSISADGRVVAFNSKASNLVPSDTDYITDIFVYDRQTGETTRVSVASDGTLGNVGSYAPSISADGQVVTFTAPRYYLLDGAPPCALWAPDCHDVFVYDRSTGETIRVSVGSDGAVGGFSSFSSAVSADGRFVAFFSQSALTPDDTNTCFKDNCTDVFIHDLLTKQTTLLSFSPTGAQVYFPSSPSVSSGGRYVAFESAATDLVPGDTILCALQYGEPTNCTDVFFRDRRPE